MMSDPVLTPTEAEATRKKVAWRILPYLFVLYIIAYLDRANIAFAKLGMSADLGFSEAVFGFGAGIFFIGYLILEIPSTVIVEKWGARRLLARILLTWGACTVITGFVQTPAQFYWARFLLGVAEGGFFPGMIVYLMHWFSPKDRARALAGFIVAIPVAMAVGGPVSAVILKLNWFGLEGWQWVFILQGIPAILFGFITLFYFTDRPKQARWLSEQEKAWVLARLQAEREERSRSVGHLTLWQGLRQRNVLLLGLALFSANIAIYSFVFWLPTSIQKLTGGTASAAAAWSGLPFAVAFGAILWTGRSSDRTGRRKLHTIVPLLLAALFFTLSAVPGQPFALVMLWLCLTAGGAFAWTTSFWVLPHMTLTAVAAAASIGFINSVGNLGGFVGPTVTGYLLVQGHSDVLRIGLLSLCFVMAAGLVAAIRLGPRHGPATAAFAPVEPTSLSRLQERSGP